MARAAEPSKDGPLREGRGQYIGRTWKPDFERAIGRRGGGARYRTFIPDSIADFDPPLKSSTFALAERAGAGIRELNTMEVALVPLEGLARQLLRSEALASSRIEGLELSHRKLARAAIEGEQGDYKAQEVLGNMRAMEEAIRVGESAKRITPKNIAAIHAALAIAPPLDRIAGQYRTEQGWIGGASPPQAEFVPSPPEKVDALIKDLCRFTNRDDISPVVQAAIAHAQFETIHPFGDGNGRVGRCLIQVIFRRRGIATRYVPPVSLVLGANKDAYIAGLEDFRADKVDEWTAQFARAAEVASQRAEGFSDQVSGLQQDWIEKLGPMRRDAIALRVVENLPAFPFITTKIVQDLTGKSDVAALKGLARLEDAGILTRHRNKRKGDSWETKELFRLLDEFEKAVSAP
jgi:Fic family protein